MRAKLWMMLALILALFALDSAPAAAQSGCGINNPVQALFVTPEIPPRVYLFIHHRLYESRNAGEAWTHVSTNGLGGLTPIDLLAIDYRRPTTLYLLAYQTSSDTYYLYRSLDGGRTFERRGAGMPSYRRLNTLAVDFRNSDVLYGGLYRGDCGGPCGEFVRSGDGGNTWSRFDQQVDAGGFRLPVRKILVDPLNPAALYAETLSTYRFLGDLLYRGDQNGDWTAFSLPSRAMPNGFTPSGIAFDPNARLLWTGTFRAAGLDPPREDQRLFRTSNYDAPNPTQTNWTPVSTFDLGAGCWPAARDSVSPLAVDARSNLLYVRTTTTDTALWKTPDQGRSWQYVVVPPQPDMPLTSESFKWVAPATKHSVSGEWLTFLRAHGDTDNLGYPRTEVIADPMNNGQTVQYFQRLILEYHPQNAPAYRIQRRLLGDLLYPGGDPPHPKSDPPPGPWHYFPFSSNAPTGLGHFVANFTRGGQPVYFKEYFDLHGGVEAFGYPKEEPKLRSGKWTQRYQAAVFEYHPEFDRDGFLPGSRIPYRNFRVQLELLGDKYIELNKLPYR